MSNVPQDDKFAPPEDDWLAPEKKPEPRQRGKIFTFYSFKGGVGRSMSMANIAVLIAASGKKVLMVDFDLEAPGLEHFFLEHDATLKSKVQESGGVIDLLQQTPSDWKKCRAEINLKPRVWKSLAPSTDIDAKSIRLDIMHSGKASRNHEDYTKQVQDLDWTSLYQMHDIGTRFAKLRAEWIEEYDFVFIDSRTGVTDIGDLCTVVLPDRLVMLFVTNNQNINGIGDMYHRVLEEHASQPIPRDKLKVLPVLSRDEFYSEDELSRIWRGKAAKRLKPLFKDWLPESLEPLQAMQKIFIPYLAKWSFGEALPVVTNPDDILNPARINAAYSRISQLMLADLNWAVLDKMADPAEAASVRAAQKEELDQERAEFAEEMAAERQRMNFEIENQRKSEEERRRAEEERLQEWAKEQQAQFEKLAEREANQRQFFEKALARESQNKKIRSAIYNALVFLLLIGAGWGFYRADQVQTRADTRFELAEKSLLESKRSQDFANTARREAELQRDLALQQTETVRREVQKQIARRQEAELRFKDLTAATADQIAELTAERDRLLKEITDWQGRGKEFAMINDQLESCNVELALSNSITVSLTNDVAANDKVLADLRSNIEDLRAQTKALKQREQKVFRELSQCYAKLTREGIQP